MYKNFNRRKSFKPKSLNYEDSWGQKDAQKPDDEGDVKTLIAQKAYSGLPRSNSAITPKLDPYTEILPGSYPYALLNRFNRPVGGSYSGDDNLDGGNTKQFLTSESSVFLHAFDSMAMSFDVNYRYLPIKANDNARGKQYTNEMIRAIDEVISSLNATTYTNLAVNEYTIECDIPTGTFEPDDKEKKTYKTSGPAGLYLWLIFYQLILCSVAGAITTFNKARANMGNMMRTSQLFRIAEKEVFSRTVGLPLLYS